MKAPEAAMRVYFLEEPRQECYRALIDALLPHSATVLLVAREQLKLSDDAKAVFRRLLPFLLRRVRTTTWPGTELRRGFAHVNHYPASPEVAAVVKTAVSGLFEWKQPKRPEDLCFLGRDGAPVLTTLAHEKDAWLDLPAHALDEVRKAVGSRFLGSPR